MAQATLRGVLLLAGIVAGWGLGVILGTALFWVVMMLFAPLISRVFPSSGEFISPGFVFFMMVWNLYAHAFGVIGLVRGIYAARWIARRYLPTTDPMR